VQLVASTLNDGDESPEALWVDARSGSTGCSGARAAVGGVARRDRPVDRRRRPRTAPRRPTSSPPSSGRRSTSARATSSRS
jgi:hypothetical protein